ncbi:hypothetical protein NDU88_005561 [Pleurodeles waltl]|uniref:Uncharacterized protein n=1 Tax=Pleurodeles waltl TaxID=8319 RepID=A0AAV7UJW4_PLEWA|nr:hypothetical protein NDU88_005561 [Pleurodeles waltl]
MTTLARERRVKLLLPTTNTTSIVQSSEKATVKTHSQTQQDIGNAQLKTSSPPGNRQSAAQNAMNRSVVRPKGMLCCTPELLTPHHA